MTSFRPLETDQQRCYDASGAEIACTASGQDAADRKTADHAGRFLPRGDIVTDTWTGLIWLREANPFQFPYAWEEASALIEDLNRSTAHGRGDWRLPSRQELFSLVSHQQINPALPEGHPFVNVFPGYYWSATTCARLKDQAWYVHLGGARVYRGMKSGAYLVWPVSGPRREVRSNGERFEAAGPVLVDRLTQRRWTRAACRNGSLLSWEDALQAAAALNRQQFGGLSDWRLPNIRELESLVDLARHSPALPANHLFEGIPEGCWSATTSVYEPRYAWALYLRDGAVGVGFKKDPTFSAWAVA